MESALGWWRLRNGSYAQITQETQHATWYGEVFDPDGKLFIRMRWDSRFNSLISRDFDLINRYGGENERGWPQWLVKIVGNVVQKEP